MSDSAPHGLLILDKPRGMTSHTAVQKVRNLFSTRKVGHAGTLDPEATGVLVLALGKATRLLEYYSDQDKSYLADLELGKVSTTGDMEGEITPSYTGKWPTPDTIELALEAFRGTTTQIPPLYSAIKVDGERLYKKARRGETVEIPERTISVSRLKMTLYEPPHLQLDIQCSKGTYVRTLAEDIGLDLKTGAYLTALRRTASGMFTLQQAQTIESLQEKNLSQRLTTLLPLGYGLDDQPAVELSTHQLEEVVHGRDIELSGVIDSDRDVFAWHDNRFIATLEHRTAHTWKPRKVFI